MTILSADRRVRPAVAVLAAALCATACGGSGTAARAGSTPQGSGGSGNGNSAVKVVASTDVYGAIVSAIGGDDVQVTSVIDAPDKDPHEYEATPRDAAAVAGAQLVVGNGGGYDDFFFRLADAAGGDRTVIDVAKLSGLEQQVPVGGEFNEHMWFSLPTMHTLADRLASDLSRLQPGAKDTFSANAKAFNDQVDGLQKEVADIGRNHPEARVAATEPLPLYLLAAADLVNVTPDEFLKASEQGNDAPAAVVQEMLQLVAGPDPVQVLLINTQTENPATDRLRAAAEKAAVPEVAVSETLSDGQTQYVAWLGGQVSALSEALDRS